MGQIEIDGTGADTIVKMYDTSVQMEGDDFYTHVDHDSMGQLFVKWLKDAPKDVTMLVIGNIILKNQVSYHINMKSEEEHLQALNMEDEHLIHKITGAIIESIGESGKQQVYIPDVHKRLMKEHLDTPSYVIFTVLKVWEFERKCVGIGEGFFSFNRDVHKDLRTLDDIKARNRISGEQE